MSKASPGISLSTLLCLCAIALTMGAAGYYCKCSLSVSAAALTCRLVGLRRNHLNQLDDVIRKALQDFTLAYGHLYVKYFIPGTVTTSTLAGGSRLCTGRTPI